MRNPLLILCLAATTACGNSAAPPPAATEPFRYTGFCEASAAARLSDTHFAVASDDSEFILIFERGKPKSVGKLKLEKITDLEGAARIGERVYWLTSHSLNKDGVNKDKRKHLVATRIDAGRSLAEEARFAGLRARIAAALGQAKDEWPLEASLNVEGLAAAPEGDLLLGLRGPLRDSNAGIVRVSRPAALLGLEPAAKPADKVHWLKLDERGIRSLEQVGTGAHAYLILAGAIGEGDKKPALYWWDGVGNSAKLEPAASLEGMVPEAMIAWPDGAIQILGDNEAACQDKDRDEQGGTPSDDRWFPSRELRLPNAVEP